MASVTDVWRAIDPEARVSADPSALTRPVRGVERTRSTPPHLPTLADGVLLVTDSALLGGTLAHVAQALAEAGVEPCAVLVADAADLPSDAPATLPVLASSLPAATLVARAIAYLADEPEFLRQVALELRLACAEAALADPQPGAPSGLVAARLRRGIAVIVDGEMVALNPRPAGRALAVRFAATHRRLPQLAAAARTAEPIERRMDGLWLMTIAIRPGASAWCFDDRPLAAIDRVGLSALAITLRALLRRAPAPDAPASGRKAAPPAPIDAESDPLRETVLAVARANGRVAPAARLLGVHRNTVLYRLRRARAELGLDPRRPEDAILILTREASARQ